MLTAVMLATVLFGQNVKQSAHAVPARVIHWSGEDWTVKRSESRVGPGPNIFSDSTENVFIDELGRLHLKITQRNGKWQCAEVVSKLSFGYGTYRFDVASGPAIDPRAVWGLFTWNNSDAAYAHREIDIEISRWMDPYNKNTQFVVQPYQHAGNMHRFDTPTELNQSTHIFTWMPDSIRFQSAKSNVDPLKIGEPIQAWSYTGKDLPKPGGETNVRINLWLFGGNAPIEGKEVEVIAKRFVFSGER